MKYLNKTNNEEIDISSNWILTYSDMVTIVLCFFIIFFVTSANENSILYDIKEKLNSRVDVLETEKTELQGENENLEKENQKLEETNVTLAEELFKLKNIEKDITTSNENFIEYLRNNELLNDVYLIQKDDGLLIRFKDSILFNSAQADLTDEGYVILEKIADKIQDLENEIRIEGFTDNVPINTERFPSNWELSSARAISVVRYFVQEKGMSPERFSVIGWGEHNPIEDNDSIEGRSKNRRIEITILNKPD
ncbi:OmpA family protein [Sporosalibacterium faouarense]|uniref:OmpA family protein n=1 Tax=Sporosalibacterium faouarense TaxID=516123 RepID=UPI00192B6683|nr:OmpA family protein [Sporosalibacterium faouarense]